MEGPKATPLTGQGGSLGAACSGHGDQQPPALELRGIGRSFGGVIAVQDVDLSLHPGEIHALMGDNGAGKSTLVKIVSGVLAPDTGSILVNGRAVHLRSARDAHALGIETVHQNLALVDTFNPVANIFLGRELTFPWSLSTILARRKMTARVRQLLDEVGVTLPSLQLRAEFLSGGQRQTTAICRALAWGSQVILLDEPTAALGVQESERVLGLISKMASRGMAVLLISHNLEQVFKICQRVTVLRQGRRVGERVVSDALPNEVVALITGAAGLSTVESYNPLGVPKFSSTGRSSDDASSLTKDRIKANDI